MDVDEDDEGSKEVDRSSDSDHKAFLILCDVACGKIHEMRRSQYMEHAPPPYHSVKAIGQFNTTSNWHGHLRTFFSRATAWPNARYQGAI